MELTYFDEPNYTVLDTAFEKCMSRRAIKEIDPYDWEKTDNGEITENGNKQNAITLSSGITYEYFLIDIIFVFLYNITFACISNSL